MTNLETVTDAAKEVLKVLGEGYDEGVYEEALAHELRLRQIAYERQRNFEILYNGYRIGEGRIDFIINPLWAGLGGKELVLELKAVKTVTEGHKRQAQVYMLSLNIDEGAVMNFASEVQVVGVEKPSKTRDLAVAKPACVSGCTILDLLDASAREAYRYLGQEFIYREDAKGLFPVALGVELRLRGCEFAGLNRAVLYKGHRVTDRDFSFCFSDGSVAETTFYKKSEEIDVACDELRFYKKEFGLGAAYLIAFPEKEKDEVKVVSV
jgi:GxxExxY protein